MRTLVCIEADTIMAFFGAHIGGEWGAGVGTDWLVWDAVTRATVASV